MRAQRGAGGQVRYLSKHNDVETDAIGLDECATLRACQVTVVLGKPEEGRGQHETGSRTFPPSPELGVLK